MSFSSQLRAFAEKAGVSMDTVVRKVVIDMGSSIVRMTPVDTGRARANWNISEGSIDTTTTPLTDPSGLTTQGKFASYNVKAGGIYYITNSLPYIERLETGWSKQSPNGMVRLTVARYKRIVDAATVGT